MEITNVNCTCSACPSQWEITLKDGRMIYVRYRWGTLSIRISKEPTTDVGDAVGGDVLVYEQIGDEFDGSISYSEIQPYLKKAGITNL